MTPDVDELLRHVRPVFTDADGPVEVTGGDSLTVTWSSGSLSVDRYAVAADRLSMRRLAVGRSPDPGEHVHHWVSLRDITGEQVWTRQSTDPAALAVLLDQWLHAAEPAPITLSPENLTTPPRRTGRLTVEIPDSLPGVELLDDEDAAALAVLLPTVDRDLVAENWPQDAKGRPSPRTTVVLAEFGPISTTKKQPCLTATSGTLKDATARVSVTTLYVDNARDSWSGLPWLWRPLTDRESTPSTSEPPSTETGWFDNCARSQGVDVNDSVRLLAAGRPWNGFETVPPAWQRELRDALATMNLAALPAALTSTRERVDASRKTRLPVGRLQRRLVLFSGQRHQSKTGLFLAESGSGGPVLTIAHSASNAVIADARWRRNR